MTIGQLRQTYYEVFGETTNSHNKPWLRRRISWQLQANLSGGLSQRGRTRASELADERFLGGKLPKLDGSPPKRATRDPRLPKAGTHITRDYKGQKIVVTVLEEGFRFNEHFYPSLSSVAKVATGAHWNGYGFFGLKRKETNT